jgi:hypothetical protein
VQLELNLRVIGRRMKRTQFDVIQGRVGAKARITSRQVTLEVVLAEFVLVGQTGIRCVPGVLADFMRQILDCRLRRR